MTLQPSKPGIPQEALPYIHFLPAENFKPPANDYQVSSDPEGPVSAIRYPDCQALVSLTQCPLYRTNVRAGVLSTTVRSPLCHRDRLLLMQLNRIGCL